MVAGALVTALGAPAAVLLDAFSYLASGAAIASIRTSEAVPPTVDQPPGLRREIGEGLRWVYHDRMLAPLAITTHGWFFFNSVLVTVFIPFALLRLHAIHDTETDPAQHLTPEPLDRVGSGGTRAWTPKASVVWVGCGLKSAP